jgi:hypothetical protein
MVEVLEAEIMKLYPIKNKKQTKDRGPCVICGKWTTCKEPLKHEKWNNEWRESFICLDCLSVTGPG